MPALPCDSAACKAAQDGDADAAAAIFARYQPYILKVARDRANDLGLDLIDDVAGEVWAAFSDPGVARYDPDRSEPRHYLRGLVFNAVRRVRAQLAVASDEEPIVPGYVDTDLQALETKEEVEFVFAGEPLELVSAAFVVAGADVPVSVAAPRLGMTRFKLSRELEALYERARTRRRSTAAMAA